MRTHASQLLPLHPGNSSGPCSNKLQKRPNNLAITSIFPLNTQATAVSDEQLHDISHDSLRTFTLILKTFGKELAHQWSPNLMHFCFHQMGTSSHRQTPKLIHNGLTSVCLYIIFSNVLLCLFIGV